MIELLRARYERQTCDGLLDRRTLIVVVAIGALVVGGLGTVQVTAASSSPATEDVNVTVNVPVELEVGDTERATVVASGADSGVSAYNITIATNNSDVATLERSVDVHGTGGDGPLTSVDRSADGSEITVTVALLDATHDPGDEIELFDVPIESHTEGTVDLSIAPDVELATIELEQYDLENRGAQSIAVDNDSSDDRSGPFLPPPSGNDDDESDLSQALFELDTVDVEPEVPAGETLSLDAPVENVGERSGVTDVTVRLDDDIVETETLQLDAGDREELSLEVRTPAEPGEYALSVETPNNTFETTLSVVEPESESGAGEDSNDSSESNESTDTETTPASEEADNTEPTPESEETDDGVVFEFNADGTPGFGILAAVIAIVISTVFARRSSQSVE